MKLVFKHGDKNIGELYFSMGEVVGGKTCTLERDLKEVKEEEIDEEPDKEDSHGKVTINAETVKQSKQHFDLKLKWQNINNYNKMCCSLFKSLKPVYFIIQRE